MRRHKTLLHWLNGHQNGVSLAEVLQFTFELPFAWKGKKKVSSITQVGESYKIFLTDTPHPIYWPVEMPLTSFYQVVAELYYHNWWNYEVTENNVKANDIVLDCGAAEGLFSLLVAPRCQKVYAIEPHPLFVNNMQQTFKNTSNIEIVPIGLGDKIGCMQLSSDGIMSKFGNGGGISVPIDTVDNLFFEQKIPVSFIKADLEGYELHMLKGAKQTIQYYRPKLSITTYHFAEDFEKTRDFILSISPDYHIKGVGIEDRFGVPIMLHAWVEK